MSRVVLLLILIFSLPGWLYAQSGAAPVLVMTEDLPPFNLLENGKVTGISTEAVRYIFNDTGIAMKEGDVQLYP